MSSYFTPCSLISFLLFIFLRLILSIRFRSVAFHLPVEKASVKISGKKGEIICKLQQVGALKHVTQLMPFMDEKLFIFTREVVANKNWIGMLKMKWCFFLLIILERELNPREIDTELAYRDFLVYPSVEQSIVIAKQEKVGNKKILKYLTITVDVDKFQFVVWRDEVGDSHFLSFNAILLSTFDSFLYSHYHSPSLILVGFILSNHFLRFFGSGSIQEFPSGADPRL